MIDNDLAILDIHHHHHIRNESMKIMMRKNILVKMTIAVVNVMILPAVAAERESDKTSLIVNITVPTPLLLILKRTIIGEMKRTKIDIMMDDIKVKAIHVMLHDI